MPSKNTSNDQTISRYTLPEKNEEPSPSSEQLIAKQQLSTSTQPFWARLSDRLWMVFIVGCLLIAVGAGAWVFRQGQLPAQPVVMMPSAEPSAAPVEEAVIPVKVDRTAFTIRVLNGSGKKGAAAAVKEQLEKAGFVVVAVGNADKATYRESEVMISSGVSIEFAQEVQQTLSEYTFSASPSALVKKTKTAADVDIVIGEQ